MLEIRKILHEIREMLHSPGAEEEQQIEPSRSWLRSDVAELCLHKSLWSGFGASEYSNIYISNEEW